tara:strand:- start:8032 stop:8547 length:516 start_codon:yes stop_codon:yes gene_type:complete
VNPGEFFSAKKYQGRARRRPKIHEILKRFLIGNLNRNPHKNNGGNVRIIEIGPFERSPIPMPNTNKNSHIKDVFFEISQKEIIISIIENESEMSVETTPAWRKNSGREKRIKQGRKKGSFLLAIYLEIKKTINKLKIREGSLTKNSFSPNIDIEIAESQVDNGGLAQKGTP